MTDSAKHHCQAPPIDCTRRSPTGRTRFAIATAIVICCMIFAGCNTSPRTVSEYELIDGAPSNWTMSPDDAVLAATDYCARNAIDLKVHSTPTVSCDSLDGDRLWCVGYDGFTRIPGDHFMLFINDETGTVEYVAGE